MKNKCEINCAFRKTLSTINCELYISMVWNLFDRHSHEIILKHVSSSKYLRKQLPSLSVASLTQSKYDGEKQKYKLRWNPHNFICNSDHNTSIKMPNWMGNKVTLREGTIKKLSLFWWHTSPSGCLCVYISIYPIFSPCKKAHPLGGF